MHLAWARICCHPGSQSTSWHLPTRLNRSAGDGNTTCMGFPALASASQRHLLSSTLLCVCNAQLRPLVASLDSYLFRVSSYPWPDEDGLWVGLSHIRKSKRRWGVGDGHGAYIIWLRVDVKRCWDWKVLGGRLCNSRPHFKFSLLCISQSKLSTVEQPLIRNQDNTNAQKLLWVVPASWLFLLLLPLTPQNQSQNSQTKTLD